MKESSSNIFVNAEVCTGCGMCEFVCSIYKEGESNPSRARLHVERRSMEGVYVPRICRNCQSPACVKACHRKALTVDPKTGWVILDYNKCNNCTLCIPACPYHSIMLTPDKKVLLCDLCNGDPQCVKVCATQAIRFAPRQTGTMAPLPSKANTRFPASEGESQLNV